MSTLAAAAATPLTLDLVWKEAFVDETIQPQLFFTAKLYVLSSPTTTLVKQER